MDAKGRRKNRERGTLSMNQRGCPKSEGMPLRLLGTIQHYNWGTSNEQAYIPRLLGMIPEKDKPYAELWIGSHPKDPSRVDLGGKSIALDAWIAQNPGAVLGPSVARRFGGLPYLLKVISAAEPLSIQAHPDRKLARRLHTANPSQYPDANHKPEIAVALDGLSALVGIMPPSGIKRRAARYPEIATLLSKTMPQSAGMPANARDLFLGLLAKSQAEPALFETQISLLRGRLKSNPRPDETESLFLNLADRYDATDAGLACLFLMNRIDLEPGQAVFLPPGIPHAYLKGNIVECMANSDNVVRLGLTRKFKDITAWTDMLPEAPAGQPVLDIPGPREDFEFETPAEEFRISRHELETRTDRRFVTGSSLEILLLIRGKLDLLSDGLEAASSGCTIEQGQSWLIPGSCAAYSARSLEPSLLFRVRVP